MTLLDLFTKKREETRPDNTSAISLLDWQVNPETCTLRNLETGAEVRVTPRGMEVLTHLINNPEQVISANELLELFWSNSVRSDHAVHNVIAELRAALGDRASAPKYIKTYPKRGYALLPIPAFGKTNAQGAKDKKEEENEQTPRNVFSKTTLAYASTLLVVVVAVYAFLIRQPAPSQTEKAPQHTILVRAFESLDMGIDEVYLSRQLPGSLVTSLSRLPNAQVVVENETGGASAQADYVLNGSIQQISGHNRVQINLTNAHTNVILFSDQFNFVSEEIFAIQDQIVEHVATALRIYLDGEQRRDMRDWGTNSPVAYDAFLKAEFYSKESSNDSFEKAIAGYLFAVEKDPDFVNAYVGLANSATSKALYGNIETNIETGKLVNLALRELLRIDADSRQAQAVKFLALRLEGNNQNIIEARLRSLILEGSPPDFAISHYSWLLVSAKLFAEAQDFLASIPDRTPYSVSPDATWVYRNGIIRPTELIPLLKQQLLVRPTHLGVLGSLARSYAFVGDYEQATAYLARQLEHDADGQSAMLSQVVISALFGRSSESGERLEAQHKDNPEFNFAMGVKRFILNDIEGGVAHWRNLSLPDNRRLFAWLDKADIFFPISVLEDARYASILEELQFGESWQRQLMEGVVETNAITGTHLSPPSAHAHARSQRLYRNNLWNHEEIDYPEPTQLGSYVRPGDAPPK